MVQKEPNEAQTDRVRRRLLKASALAGGALVAGVLPYRKPAVKSFFGVRWAWAQPSGVMMIMFQGQLGTMPSGTPQDTGQDRWLVEMLQPNTTLTITVTPDINCDPEIFLYPPGTTPGPGVNHLLAGSPFGFDTAATGAVESTMVTVPAAGIYIFAIEDGRPTPMQQAGEYTVSISANKPILPAVAGLDETTESD